MQLCTVHYVQLDVLECRHIIVKMPLFQVIILICLIFSATLASGAPDLEDMLNRKFVLCDADLRIAVSIVCRSASGRLIYFNISLL